MREAPTNPTKTVQLSRAQRLDAGCVRFEAEWRAGRRPRIEDHLSDLPASEHPALVRELLLLEIYYRRAGEDPRPADYHDRFPALDPSWLARAVTDPSAAGSPPTLPTAPSCASPAAVPAVPGYEILEELGRGGMGVVYRARQRSLSRLVALKMILAGEHAGPEERARFRTEAEAVARLQHPNIVEVYEVGEHAGWPYLALELVDAGSLAGRLAQTPQPARPAAQLVETLARAIHHAHRRGILHRDLKPSNVLFTTEDTPKITDFGLAKIVAGGADQTPTWAVLGTPSYMAPEQAGGKAREVGPAADVYGLGAILYEMVTGRPPFLGETPLETMAQVVSHEPVPVRRLQPKVPRDLETVCLKCLEKDPTRRYTSAEELAEDLRRFQNNEPIRARRASGPERAWRWCRRNRAAAAAMASVALLVLGALAAAFWYVQDRADRRAERIRQAAREEQAIVTALHEAAVLGERAETLTDNPSQWETALASVLLAVERAEGLLASAEGPLDPALYARAQLLAARLRSEEKDRRMLATLEELRRWRSEANVGEGRFSSADAVPQYREAFRTYGLVEGSQPSGEAAALLRQRRLPVQATLVAALDDWMFWAEPASPERDWLRAVLAGADNDPWRNQVRAAVAANDLPTLQAMADREEAVQQPPAALVLLSEALKRLQAVPCAIPLLRRAQQRYPGDFWINHYLARALHMSDPPQLDEAVGFYRATLALRPNNVGVCCNLGVALNVQGRLAEAVAVLRRAVEIEPRDAKAHNALGGALYRQKKFSEAIDEFREAIRLQPSFFDPHVNLGIVLTEQGKLPEAIDELQKAVQINPNHAYAHYRLGVALHDRGEVRAATDAYQKAIALKEDFAEAHFHLGRVLRRRGKLVEALDAMRRGHELGSKRQGWTQPSKEMLRECELLVDFDRRLPQLLRREGVPRDPGELILVAEACACRKLYGAAARFCEAAFTARPELEDSINRFNAVSYAARAGCGQSEDNPPLDEPTRARWRKKALDWLRAELIRRTKQLESGKPADRAAVRRTLSTWSNYRGLAGLRDAAELARLPADEQKEWQQFWAEVAALLRKAAEEK